MKTPPLLVYPVFEVLCVARIKFIHQNHHNQYLVHACQSHGDVVKVQQILISSFA